MRMERKKIKLSKHKRIQYLSDESDNHLRAHKNMHEREQGTEKKNV